MRYKVHRLAKPKCQDVVYGDEEPKCYSIFIEDEKGGIYFPDQFFEIEKEIMQFESSDVPYEFKGFNASQQEMLKEYREQWHRRLAELENEYIEKHNNENS